MCVSKTKDENPKLINHTAAVQVAGDGAKPNENAAPAANKDPSTVNCPKVNDVNLINGFERCIHISLTV